MSGIPWWAFPGNKVVFVGSERPDACSRGFVLNSRPCLNTIYTVRETEEDKDGFGYLRIAEMRISGLWPNGRKFSDGWMGIDSFRPLVSQDDNIELAIYLGKNRHAKRPQKADT